MQIDTPDRVALATPAAPLPKAAWNPAHTPGARLDASGASIPLGVLSFRLADSAFGLDIHAVREIRSFEPPTRLAGAASDVLGVVNLRGTVVPVIDLRLRLGLAARQASEGSVVIVVEIGQRWIGGCVDAVDDVFDLSAHTLSPVPELGDGQKLNHLQGVVTLPDRLLLLLDVVALLGDTAAPATPF